MKDDEIARVLRVGHATVGRVRRRCVEEGLGRALGRKEQVNRRPRKLDGEGGPPDGPGLLATARPSGGLDAATTGGPVSGAGDMGPHQRGDGALGLKKPTQTLTERVLVIPPKGSAEFVCALEDMLDVYHRDYEEQEVLVCLDETSKQLVKETRQPRPARPGAPASYDYEYQRN